MFSDSNTNYPDFRRLAASSRDCGFMPSRLERLYVVILELDLQNLIDVPDGFVCVADLEIRLDHPCDLPSCEEAFFSLCSFFLNEGSSSEVSVDDLLETTPFFLKKN